MKITNFLFEEFVDQNIFNSAMTNILSSMTELSSNSIFFIPGVVNPSSLAFTFNNNLLVNLTVTNTGVNAFKCLFQTGNYTTAHGTVNGIDLGTYTLDFTGFIPGTGSSTIYVIAAYQQVQETSTTVIGPPVGHPDYSPNFVPYTGYQVLQDTLSITLATNVPDNLTNIELARVTVAAGQTSIPSLDLSHQVLARINALFVAMSGDVTGNSNSNRISAWQGNSISLSTPSINTTPVWNGAVWTPVLLPTTLPPSGPAGGDLTGTYPNPQVARSTTQLFTANSISTGPLTASNGSFNGTVNVNAALNAAAAFLSGGSISSTGVPILGQFLSGGQLPGFLAIPTWNGVQLITIYIQWGSYITGTATGGHGADNIFGGGINSPIVIWPTPFPNACFWVGATMIYKNGTAPSVTVGVQGNGNTPNFNRTQGSFFMNLVGSDNTPGPGFLWMAVGY